MPRPPFNALQAILVRERLILYLLHRRQTERRFSVRKLIEAIVFSEANAQNPRAYQEGADDEGRYDKAMPLKNNTIGNFVTRKSSVTDAENLPLIRDFLLAEGFVSPNLLDLNARHPDAKLLSHFAGIAPTDPRLQRHRAALEGEYIYCEGQSIGQIWIAAPGRSKPFITLRAQRSSEPDMSRAPKPNLKTLNLEAARSLTRSEGRIFLLPGDTATLVEVSAADRKWSGRVYRLGVSTHGIILHNELTGSVGLDRVTPSNCTTGQRTPYGLKASSTLAPNVSNWSGRAGRLVSLGLPVSTAKSKGSATPAFKKALNQALIDGAKAGDAYAILLALVQGANVNYQDEETGRTATHWAAAANALEAVYVLASRPERRLRGQGDAPGHDRILAKYLPNARLSRGELETWRRARHRRDALILDKEHCFASAYAPVASDKTERNRRATRIWHFLLSTEIKRMVHRYDTSPFAILEVWQPSSVMKEAARLYSAPLPRGFSNPGTQK